MDEPWESDRSAPLLYSELAGWWHTLSNPADYDEEARFIRETLLSACQPHSLLELGSGGGNIASHLKKHIKLTLTDRSAGMLAESQLLNPECEHVEGDMRSLRLKRQFDAVLIHDAIVYMTSRQDLQRAIQTAAIHCRKNGALLVLPDFTRENFETKTEHGGEDRPTGSLRYLSWTYDPEPADDVYVMDFAYLLRTQDRNVRCFYDRHVCGLYSESIWIETFKACGFEPTTLDDGFERTVFLGLRL